jgi:transcriptional regulator with XRE-family HTH domain
MFKQVLRKYIEIKGITQSELASIIGDSQQAVSDFLTKEGNPHKKTRNKYFEKLVGFENFYKQNIIIDEVNDNEIEYNTPKAAIKIKDDEIVFLKKIIKDKEQIIDLLHQKIEFLEINCNCAQKKTTA